MDNRKTIDEWVLYNKVLALEVMKITDSISFGSANNKIIKQITNLLSIIVASINTMKRKAKSSVQLNS
jgi:hypothetical protein